MAATMFTSITTGAVLALVAAATGTVRAAEATDTLSVTRHEIVLGENTLRYTATAGLLPIHNDDTGEPLAKMFFVAYTLDRAAGEPPRPLTFLWNGGPGANSSQVHMLGFGPRRPRTGDAYPANPSISETELLPNEETWLVHSDLVFVDPIGTGYSRATKSEYIPILYTSRGDIEAVAEFIRVYRTRFDAWDAPLFLAGESYGTTRAMGVAEALERRRQRVAGVVLISGSFDVGDRVPRALSAALHVPTYTAAAHFHEKLPDDLQQAELDAVLREAEAWARDEYAPALEGREELSPSERSELVAGLARYTGLDPDVIDTTMTVSKPVFADRLLQDRGQELGRYDLRMAQPARDLESAEWSPMTDASLLPLLDLMQGTSPLLIRYLRHDLGFETDALYRGPFGEAFHPTPLGYRGDWMALLWNNAVPGVAGAPVEPGPPDETELRARSGAPGQATRAQPPLRRAMEINPRLRVLNVKGMYDGSCPLLEYTVSLVEPALRRRIRNECYAGGHQLYTDLAPRQELQRDFGEFVRETLASTPAPRAQTAAQTEAASERAPVGTIEHVWKPVRNGGEEVTAIEVRTELTGIPDSVGRDFSLNAPITYAGVPGIADRVRDLRVADPAGEVRLQVEDDEPHPGGFPYFRRWRAERDVTFPVVISYRSLAPTEAPRGPPFGLLSAYGGVSGAGSGFLVLPEGDLNVTSRVHWDLTDLEAGSSGVTPFGVGDFEVRGSPARLRQGWIMAGPVGSYPEAIGEGFSAVWLGTPAWDPQQEMAWAEEMYNYLGRTYGYLDPLPSYRVFIRVGFRSGTALGSSFMGGAPPRQPGAAPEGQASRGTFIHEMTHMWVGGIEGPQGVTSWFSEGLTTYYTRLLPMRGGFTSVEEYGREINQAFERYYTSPSRNLSADSIVRVGFNDEEIRHMPYIRGSLYFADLDAKIRAHSGGARDLDRVLFEIFERRQAGERFDHDVWIETVVREAGPSARADFEDIIIRGTKTLVPVSDAFGPCFERQPTTFSVDGEEIEGYEWVRVPSVPDEICRDP